MTVRQPEEPRRSESGDEPPLMSVKALLIVSITVAAIALSITHPAWGAAVLAGAAVLTVLDKIIGK